MRAPAAHGRLSAARPPVRAAGALPSAPGQGYPLRALWVENLMRPAQSRIRLDVDPMISPRRVAQVYRQVQARFTGAKLRMLSAKGHKLALFAWRAGARPDAR